MLTIDRSQPIPIAVALGCDVPTKYPQAVVRDATGAVLFGGPIDLTPVGEGRYQDFTKNHPTVGFVTVVYTIYDDAAHTVESDFQRSMDIFRIKDEALAATPISAIGAIKALLVPELKLSGILGDDELIGSLGPEKLLGSLGSDSFTGVLSEQMLIGRIECD